MEPRIDLIVHGIPQGKNQWANCKFESQFIDGFYHEYKYENQMVVEVSRIGGTPECFYSYIVSGTQDCSGRPGGYFGLTLRMNQVYTDFANIYFLLEATFRKYVEPAMFAKTGKNYQFKKADFDSFTTTLTEAEKEIRAYLMNFSVNSDFKPITSFGNAPATINVQDCQGKDCESLIRKYNKIVVTTHCTSNREASFVDNVSKLTRENTNLNALLKQEKETVQKLQSEKANLQRDVDEARSGKSRMVKLEQDNAQLKDKLGKVSAVVRDIAAVPLQQNSQSGVFDHTHSAYRGKKKSNNGLLLVVNTALLIVICLICLLVLKKSIFPSTKTDSSLEQRCKNLVMENSGLKSQVESLTAQLNSNVEMLNSFSNIQPENESDGLRINIEGISSNETVKAGMTYKWSVKKAGSRVMADAKIDKQKSKNIRVNSNGDFIPQKVGPCTIVVCVDGKTAQRTVTVCQ